MHLELGNALLFLILVRALVLHVWRGSPGHQKALILHQPSLCNAIVLLHFRRGSWRVRCTSLIVMVGLVVEMILRRFDVYIIGYTLLICLNSFLRAILEPLKEGRLVSSLLDHLDEHSIVGQLRFVLMSINGGFFSLAHDFIVRIQVATAPTGILSLLQMRLLQSLAPTLLRLLEHAIEIDSCHDKQL